MKIVANVLIILGILILLLTFWQPAVQEVKYQIRQSNSLKVGTNPNSSGFKVEELVPEDNNFGIVIPKIGANAKVFADINPFESKEYLPILKKGVAHAKGTGFPGEGRNIYLFAHSVDSFFNFQKYNAVFYLIGKLNKDDEIDVYFQEKLFKYSVLEKFVTSPQAVWYLKPEEEETLILQTCYPPGTTFKRLIVRAKRI